LTVAEKGSVAAIAIAQQTLLSWSLFCETRFIEAGMSLSRR
jgi:hypothetical protein